jgi:hypothetical protein
VLPDGSVDFPGVWTDEGRLVLTGSDWNQVRADSPDVLHAVLALPVLVAAARRVSEFVGGGKVWAADGVAGPDFDAVFDGLDDALALVDGEGRADA